MCKYLKKVFVCETKEYELVCMCKKNMNYMRIIKQSQKSCAGCKHKESDK